MVIALPFLILGWLEVQTNDTESFIISYYELLSNISRPNVIKPLEFYQKTGARSFALL
jgi:hypothetical protein